MTRGYGQYCGLAKALELVGGRWSLLIIRELLTSTRRLAKHKFSFEIETSVDSRPTRSSFQEASIRTEEE